MISPEEATSDRIYDKCAAGYGYDIHATVASRLKFQLAKKYLNPDFTVIDVGCGNGNYLTALAPYCHDITGVDINDEMLTLARRETDRRNLENVRFSKQSASALDFDDEAFDLAYSYSTLLLVPDTTKAILEIVRVLKRGGVGVVDIFGKMNLSRFHWSHYYKSQGHFGVNSFSLQEIRELLESAGMLILEQHALGVMDQWKYIPVLNRLGFIDSLFHGSGATDRDYRISNTPSMMKFASRWYFVCRRGE